jgi:hypothetical protein
MHMVDTTTTNESSVSLEKPARTLTDKFQQANAQRRKRFLTYLTLALAVALVLLIFSSQISSLVSQAVNFFYNAESDSWAGQLFNSVASSAFQPKLMRARHSG